MSLTQAQKDRLARADEIIAQAQAKSGSKQPRFDRGADGSIIYNLTMKWSKELLEQAPAYQADSRDRSLWLNKFWTNEPYLAGVINSVVQIDRNRGWSLIGGRNQVIRFSNVLHNFQVAPGKPSWRNGVGALAQSFYTTDIGGLGEVGRQFQNGPMAGLFQLDPTRCKLTGSPDYPLMYYPKIVNSKTAQSIPFAPEDYVWVNSMSNLEESFNGLGYCALSRVMELAVVMTAVWRHEQEMLFARAPKGLLLLRGITDTNWKKAMKANEVELDSKEQEWFGNVAVFASGGDVDIDAKLFMLSNLPEGFDQKVFTDLLMFGYSLAFGYDAREFWPVSGGALGTATETETQHRKATDKGGREFWFGFQEQIQNNLPPTLHFESDERNVDGELLDAQLAKAKADAIQALRGSMPSEPIIDTEQAKELAAEQNLIPREWTEVEEDEEATDTSVQARKRVLEYVEVQQAIDQFPDEPLVMYRWPQERMQVLYLTGKEARKRYVQGYQLDTISGPVVSKQGRFLPVTRVMRNLANEVEKELPVVRPAIEDTEPKMGWLRREWQELKTALGAKPTEPVQVTIHNQPPPPANVEMHNYMDGRSLEEITAKVEEQHLISKQLLEVLARIQSPTINVEAPAAPPPIIIPPAEVVVQDNTPTETNVVWKAIRKLTHGKD